MKSKNANTAALLLNKDTPKTYTIDIKLNSKYVKITVSDKDLAELEYYRIKGQGIWNGQWITEITLKDD